MNPLRIALAIASTATACLSALSCQSGPSTSSSSNWVVCDMPADCGGVSDAVDCVDGYCVDAQGDRVEQSGSGGGSASGGTSATGGSPGSGGSLGGSGSGGTGVGNLTCVDAGELSACAADEDCTVATWTDGCCGGGVMMGVSTADEETFWALDAACNPSQPDCQCIAPGRLIADDGRIVSGEVGVTCVSGTCKSRIEERPCGDALTCVLGEICISTSTLTGPTETFESTCVENPCGSDPFDCTCAAPVCDQDDGHSRLCTVSLFDDAADILCQDQAQ